jgi:hypothetical protein
MIKSETATVMEKSAASIETWLKRPKSCGTLIDTLRRKPNKMVEKVVSTALSARRAR